MAIWKYFGFSEAGRQPSGQGAKASPADTDTVRKIVQALDRLEPAQARFLAAFAYLLGRVAYADHHISEEETRKMEHILSERAHLPEEQAILAVHMAKTQNRLFGGTENFLVSREFGKIAGREEKMELLECLYAVCAADHSISVVEDNEIRKISRELSLGHEDFIAVRMHYREHLAVLKNPSGTESR